MQQKLQQLKMKSKAYNLYKKYRERGNSHEEAVQLTLNKYPQMEPSLSK